MSDLEIRSPELIADWIETSLLVHRIGHVGLDSLFRLAEEELGREPVAVSPALSVMRRRGETLGALYPFQVVPDIAVTRRESPQLASYITLLFLTPESVARQTVCSGPDWIGPMGELLEKIAEAALCNLWGPGGQALSFGHPSRHGRPAPFDQAVGWLADQMGVEIGQGYRDPRRQDGGVDIVAWRRFFDGRRGFPIALAQCTIQRETFTKTSDIDLRLWASWLALDVDPLSLLVMPGTIREAGTEWNQFSTVVMVIERLRLIELLARGEAEVEGASRWANDLVVALRDVLTAAEV